jgi:hypothetical protein
MGEGNNGGGGKQINMRMLIDGCVIDRDWLMMMTTTMTMECSEDDIGV